MANKKPKRLKPDGSYGEDINAYTNLAEIGKQQFLTDGNALLKEVGQHLAQHGFTEHEIHANPSGIAGSGDVYGSFWNPLSPAETIYCTVGESSLSTGRKDGLVIMARKEERVIVDAKGNKKNWRTTTRGANQWIDPGQNSLELAATLLRIMQMPQNVDRLLSTAYHSRTAGVVAFPSPFVTGPEQALEWSAQHASIQQAMTEDAGLQDADSDPEPAFKGVQMALPV